MNINWVTIGLLTISAYFWVNVYLFGLFQTVMWSVVITSIIGIIIKLKQEKM